MDKYEFKLKLDQMKALAAEGEYTAAAEIADTINWRKVRNVRLLVKAGDVYIKQKRFDEARDVLLMAYDRSPIGRTIIFRLAEIAIKMKNFEEAEEYYDEFVEAAPHDNLRYILLYKLIKAKGADLGQQIAVLEDLKEAEYTEEWAYQLAYLYHQAGESEKCVSACDELVLWFGDGIYVEKALELKMYYQPLTKVQEEKYRESKQRKHGVEVPRDAASVRIPEVQENIEKFNTANLQEELAKSMQQIMEATEKETVDDTMDNIKKMVGEIPYLQVPHSENQPQEHIETDAEIDVSIRDNFQEMNSANYNGRTETDNETSIEDVLSGWEKTRRAAQAALQMAQRQRLASAKARALQEAEEIMERLADVMPKLDAGITPSQLMREEYMQQENSDFNEERAGRIVAGMNDMLQQQIEKLQEEADATVEKEANPPKAKEPESKKEHELLRKIKKAKPNFDEQIGIKPYVPTQFDAQEETKEPEPKEPMADAADSGSGQPEESEIMLVEEMRLAEAEFYGVIPEEIQSEEIEQDSGGQEQDGAQEPPAEPEAMQGESSMQPHEDEENAWGKDVLKQDTKEIKAKLIAEALQKQENIQEQTGAERLQRQEAKLSDEQKAIFSYFVPVADMENQISIALHQAEKYLTGGQTPATGNILIQGGKGCGKTVLATGLIKSLQKKVRRPKGKIGKIDAETLNKKDISELLKKVAGGCLIIERAGAISRETAVRLSLLLKNDESGSLVIMEDTRVGLNQALSQDEGFAKRFTEKIVIPVFTSDELVEFGKAYAHDLDYEIDNMGVLALYNRISNIQKLDRATTLTEVKEIVDEAIEKAEKKSIKKAFSILTSKRYTEDDYIILREKDFEE